MVKIILECERMIAVDSPDHIVPTGTRRDNSRNRLFNDELYLLYGGDRRLCVLDLGCAGGGFVKDLIDDGHLAIGLEGSDYSKKFKRAEWRTIPEYLFTCDATRRFDIYATPPKRRLMFNVITSWEFMEHIREDDLPKLIENVKKHMAKDGMWIMSIANASHIVDGIELHQLKRPKMWWIEKFKKFGLIYVDTYVKYFATQFVRGKHEKEASFHLVVCKDPSSLPSIQNLGIKKKFFAHWVGSGLQIYIRRFINGEL